MAVQFNNATFSGSLASVGTATAAVAAIGVTPAVAPTYTGTSATGAAGLTSVTINGTVTTPGSTVTASVSSPSINGAAAVNLTNITANYLGYTTSTAGNVEYYFDYTPVGAATPIGFAVSGAALGAQAGAQISDAATTAPADPNFPATAAGPLLKAAVVNGSTVTLTYDDVLGGTAPQAGAFTVTSNGTALPVTGATTAGNTVTLTLGTPATANQPVTVGYTKLATAAGTPTAVQDLLGNDAATLANPLTAVNNTAAAATGGTTGTGTVGSTTGTTGTVGSTTGTTTGTTGVTTSPTGTTTVTTPAGTVTTGSTGTTVSTPVGTVTVPVGTTTSPTGTTVTTPVGTVSTGAGGTTVTTPVGTVTVPVGVTTGTGGTTVTTPVGTVTVPVGVTTGSGGTTITTPVGTVTVPVGGVITMPGSGGGSTTVAPSSGGSSTVTSVSPTGATTTQTIPSGSTIAAGTGAAAGDLISVDPYAIYDGKGEFTVSGHVAATSGVKTVTISAIIDGADTPTVLGTATVGADGTYSFLDKVGAHLQGFITATETDALGATTAVQSPYSLQAGLKTAGGFVTEQDLYTPDGSDYVSRTQYRPGGTSRVDVHDDGQTFRADYYSDFHNGGAPENTFVFSQGNGASVIRGFRVDGVDHDTISLPSADLQDFASVIANTQDVKGGSVITDPNTGDTIKLTGVSKAELKANPSDFAFHA